MTRTHHIHTDAFAAAMELNLTHKQRAAILQVSEATYYRYLQAYRTDALRFETYTCPACLQKHRETYPLCANCRTFINTFHARVRAHELRLRRRTIPHTFTPAQWQAKLSATRGICPGCKKNVGISKLTLDHIKPISRAREGDTYTIDDVQPLCLPCNSSKGGRA